MTGKPSGDDLVAGKPTVILALADQMFPATWGLALRRAGSAQRTAEGPAGLAGALVDFGVIDVVEEMIARAVRTGWATLDDPAIEPVAAAGLRTLANRDAWRDT